MRLANLTWPQAEKVLAQDPVVIFPIGTAEQHGRHLPLGTDMIAPEYIADRIEAMEPDVLILPSWSYGQCDSQTEFPGTISLGPQLLYEVIYKVFSGLMKHGARRLIALNGHGPNTGPIERAALELRRRGASLACLNWWRYAVSGADEDHAGLSCARCAPLRGAQRARRQHSCAGSGGAGFAASRLYAG